jgi:tetratricopeptide (TPR) repeat protein
MRSAGDRAGEGNVLNNLAVAYAHTGEKAKALALFAQAGQIFHGLQDRRMIADVSGNLGVTYDNLGEYQKALESHENDRPFQSALRGAASLVSCSRPCLPRIGAPEKQFP